MKSHENENTWYRFFHRNIIIQKKIIYAPWNDSGHTPWRVMNDDDSDFHTSPNTSEISRRREEKFCGGELSNLERGKEIEIICGIKATDPHGS